MAIDYMLLTIGITLLCVGIAGFLFITILTVKALTTKPKKNKNQ